jgi:hypothetical protein
MVFLRIDFLRGGLTVGGVEVFVVEVPGNWSVESSE